jgi:small subunit ribosomal protein S16
MAVKVRLRRMGNRNNPFYRVVAADARTATDGRFIENLGWYDPERDGTNFELKVDRVEYWKSQGAELSDTVSSLLKKAHAAPQPAPEAAPAAPPAPAPEPEPGPVADEAAAEPPAEEPADAEAPEKASAEDA